MNQMPKGLFTLKQTPGRLNHEDQHRFPCPTQEAVIDVAGATVK